MALLHEIRKLCGLQASKVLLSAVLTKVYSEG